MCFPKTKKQHPDLWKKQDRDSAGIHQFHGNVSALQPSSEHACGGVGLEVLHKEVWSGDMIVY